MRQPRPLILAVALAFYFAAAPYVIGQNATTLDKPAASARAAAAPYDDNTPGVGPIRKEDWFGKVWRERRATFAKQKAEQKHALVFLGDSITQGWSDDF